MAAVSPDFLQNAVRCVDQASSEAQRVVFECGFQPRLARDLVPYYRWKAAERNLGNLVARFPEMSSSIELNEAHNCSYVLIVAGEVRLTVAHVPSPEKIIRPAIYRNTLARLNQIAFPFWADRLPAPDGLYAVLLYGTDRRQSLTFATVAFPLADANAYDHDKLDLLDLFPGLRDELRVGKVEESEEEPIITLKPEEDEERA